MKRLAIFVGILHLILLLGCSRQTQNSPSPSVFTPQNSPCATPINTDEQEEENIELWFLQILGLSADEISNLQESSRSNWEYTTTMLGYDYYFDVPNNISYLFPNNGLPLEGDEICNGILAPIDVFFPQLASDSDEILSKLSNLLSVDFEWFSDENEENYCYLANFDSGGIQYQVNIFTEKNKEFDSSYGIQFVVYE